METKLILLMRSFSEVYGQIYNTANYTGPEYTQRIATNENNVYVHYSLFNHCWSSSYGGALNCGSNVEKLLVEQASFISCGVSSDYGGAIYFDGTTSGESVLSKICVFNCSSSFRGHFAHIFAKNDVNYKNHVNDSTLTRTEASLNSRAVLLIYNGNILFPSLNITNNECSLYPAYIISPTQGLTLITYSSIINNTAVVHYGCISHLDTGFSYCIDTCNIINNTQNSSSVYQMIIYSGQDLLIKNSCILGNNNGMHVFRVDSGQITISNCSIDHDIISNGRYQGDVTFAITIESTFTHALSHIATQGCDSYFETIKSIFHTPTETSEEVPTEASFKTPGPTWDGRWDDEPRIIIIYVDVPIIKETHYPLQTEYVKASVSSVTTATNISIGVIAIIIIIVISLYNFIRSAKKLSKIRSLDDRYEVNSEEYVGISSISEYSK
jgi:hypothetical protein